MNQYNSVNMPWLPCPFMTCLPGVALYYEGISFFALGFVFNRYLVFSYYLKRLYNGNFGTCSNYYCNNYFLLWTIESKEIVATSNLIINIQSPFLYTQKTYGVVEIFYEFLVDF